MVHPVGQAVADDVGAGGSQLVHLTLGLGPVVEVVLVDEDEPVTTGRPHHQLQERRLVVVHTRRRGRQRRPVPVNSIRLVTLLASLDMQLPQQGAVRRGRVSVLVIEVPPLNIILA